jgi:hypothetical protein
MLKKSLLKYMLIVIAVAALLCGGIAQAGAANSNEEQLKAARAAIEKADAERQAEMLKALEKELTPLEREWGVKLYGINWTAAGYMLHLRFRVLDPEKAYQLLNRHKKRYVIVEKSGAVLNVPFYAKVGKMRGSVRTPNMVKKGRNYEALFANPGRHVSRGDKVTLVIGSFMAEDLTVQ